MWIISGLPTIHSELGFLGAARPENYLSKLNPWTPIRIGERREKTIRA
jgi:hypothetical protein